MLMIVKVLCSAAVIGALNVLAHRSPGLAGWIAALPIVSFLSIAWMAFDGATTNATLSFAQAVLFGVPFTIILIGVIVLALRHGYPISLAMFAGLAVWGACTWLGLRLNLL